MMFAQRKYDGARGRLDTTGAEPRMTMRNGRDVTARVPHLLATPPDSIIHGEIVWREGRNAEDCAAVMSYLLGDSGLTNAVRFFAFDCERWAGRDISALPYRERLALMAEMNRVESWEIQSEEQLTRLLAHCLAAGFEGIVTRDPDSPLSAFQKHKLFREDEFAVVEFVPSHSPSRRVAALILERDGKPCGKVSSGISRALDSAIPTMVFPQIARIRFAHQYQSGSLRHPMFLCFRPDKESAHG